MSLRPYVTGFSLKRLLNIFGCDQSIDLVDHYKDVWDTSGGDDEEERADHKRSIKFSRSIVHGKVEGEYIVRAMITWRSLIKSARLQILTVGIREPDCVV